MKMTIITSWFFAMMISITSCRNPEPETYLIPKGFTGQVNIIFNRKDGAPPKYENGRRVYEIPSSGILLTQFKDEYGFVDHQYYYVDNNNKRTLLKIFRDEIFKDSTSNANRDEIGIFSDGTTGQYGNDGDPKMLKYQYFLVSSYNAMDSFFTPEYKKQFGDKLKRATGVEVSIP